MTDRRLGMHPFWMQLIPLLSIFILDRQKFVSYLPPFCGIDWSIIWFTLQNNMTLTDKQLILSDIEVANPHCCSPFTIMDRIGIWKCQCVSYRRGETSLNLETKTPWSVVKNQQRTLTTCIALPFRIRNQATLVGE